MSDILEIQSHKGPYQVHFNDDAINDDAINQVHYMADEAEKAGRVQVVLINNHLITNTITTG